MDATVMLVMEGIEGTTEEQSERVDEAMKAMVVITASATRLSHSKIIWKMKMVSLCAIRVVHS